MTDEQILAKVDEVFKYGLYEIANEDWIRFARALLADSGKGEAVASEEDQRRLNEYADLVTAMAKHLAPVVNSAIHASLLDLEIYLRKEVYLAAPQASEALSAPSIVGWQWLDEVSGKWHWRDSEPKFMDGTPTRALVVANLISAKNRGDQTECAPVGYATVQEALKAHVVKLEAEMHRLDKMARDAKCHSVEDAILRAAVANSATPRTDVEKDAVLLEALQKIAAIENKMFGGDWDEIEEARSIASIAILAAKKEK